MILFSPIYKQTYKLYLLVIKRDKICFDIRFTVPGMMTSGSSEMVSPTFSHGFPPMFRVKTVADKVNVVASEMKNGRRSWPSSSSTALLSVPAYKSDPHFLILAVK